MNYGTIKSPDIANGPGCRVCLFVSGCRHHCKGCFQPETWNFDFGSPYNEAVKERILSMLAPTYIEGLTVLGGEPMEPENQKDVSELVLAAKQLYPEKTIWIYSGYTLEELKQPGHTKTEYTDSILNTIDVLVDGEFIEDKKDLRLMFRGSSNQRLIDMNETRKNNQITLLDIGERA